MKCVGPAVCVARGRVTHPRCRAGLEAQTLKSGKAERPNIERLNGIDADAPFAMGPRLVERYDTRVRFGDVQ
jgi:hypothetical protein